MSTQHDEKTHLVNAIYKMVADYAQKHGKHLTSVKFKIDTSGNCNGITTTWKFHHQGKWK